MSTGTICLGWWKGLQENNGARASLRRISTEEGLRQGFRHYAALHTRLTAQSWFKAEHIPSLRVCAAVLSHVREDQPGVHFAKALAKAGYSPRRFQQLSIAETPEQLFISLVRAIRQNGGKANVAQISEAILDWSRAPHGEDKSRVKDRWQEQYYTNLEKGAV